MTYGRLAAIGLGIWAVVFATLLLLGACADDAPEPTCADMAAQVCGCEDLGPDCLDFVEAVCNAHDAGPCDPEPECADVHSGNWVRCWEDEP